MRTLRPITMTLTGVMLAALTPLAACGGTAGSTATGATATGPAGDASFHTSLSTRLVSADGQVTGLDVAGTYRQGAHPAAELRQTGGGSAAPEELRLVGDTLYIRRAGMMRPGGGGKPWTRVTRTTATPALAGLLAAVERGRPAVLLRMIGTSRAGTGTLDTTTAVRRLAAADRWPARELTAFRTLHYDVRLDTAGRPSRVTLTGAAGDRRYSLTQTFDRYGTEVHVTAPPSRQVEDGDGPVLPRAPRMAQ